MSDSLGLSIGMTNLAAARSGRPPVIRRCVLTLFDRRPPEVGIPGENPNLATDPGDPGVVLRGFVERIGDPVPLVAADGAAYSGEGLTAEALDAIAASVDHGAPVTVAIPAHWDPGAFSSLSAALAAKQRLSPGGATPPLVPDSIAALTALRTEPGMPSEGIVLLCDFGGSGTSITVADAARNLTPVGQTFRYTDFAGDLVDNAVLNHVLSQVPDAGDTAAVTSMARLREQCRVAKEQLSRATATTITTPMAPAAPVPLSRAELTALIAGPLAGFIEAVATTVQQSGIPPQRLAAIAAVGGGAQLPGIADQLSQRLRVPVITPAQPALSAAAGARILADQGGTGAAPAATTSPDAPTGLWTEPPAATGAAAAFGATGATAMAPAASEFTGGTDATSAATSYVPGPPSESVGPELAWSQDAVGPSEPTPYTGDDYRFDASGYTESPPPPPPPPADPGYAPAPGLPWYRRPPVLFGGAVVLAVLAGGGLLYSLVSSDSGSTDPKPGVSTPVEPPAPVTVTVTGDDGLPTVSTIPPPPPSEEPAPTESTSSETPTTTTTEQTTTSEQTTTTAPTTTTTDAPTTTERTTSAQPTTTKAPTTSAEPPATSEAPPDSGGDESGGQS